MNATVREILAGREQPNVGEMATEFAHAAEQLYFASRAWPTLPPGRAGELDGVGNQLEGLRRALGDMRMAMRK